MKLFSLAFLLAVFIMIGGAITISPISFETSTPISSQEVTSTSISVTQSVTTTPTPLSTGEIATSSTIQGPSTNASIVSTIYSTILAITNMTSVGTNTTSTILATSSKTTDVAITNITTLVKTTDMSTTFAPMPPLEKTEITSTVDSTTPVETTEITSTVDSTTALETTEITSTIHSTTPVETTGITSTVDSTTPLETTEITSISHSTTPVETTGITSTVDSTTPLETTEITSTIHSTTPVETTGITSTVNSTTPLETTEITSTIHSTTPVETTGITSTVDSTTPLETTKITSTIHSTTPVETTGITTIIDSTTPVKTTYITSHPTTAVKTTVISSTTTQITTSATTGTLPLTTLEMNPTNSTTELQYSSGIHDTTTIREIYSTISLSTSLPTTTFSSTTPVIKWQQLNVVLRILESWSPKYLVQNSDEYSTLEKHIETNVNASLNGTLSGVTILEFRPGSVIAELSLNTSESKALDIMKTAVQKGEVGKLRVSPSFPLQLATSVIISTKQQHYTKVEGDTLSVQCTSSSNTKRPTDVKIMWMLNGLPIMQNNKTKSRIKVSYKQNPKIDTTIGILTFRKLKLRDTGKLLCLGAGDVNSNTVEISLTVTPLPKVKITTNTPYVGSGQNVTLKCSVVNNVSANITFLKINGSFRGNTTKHSNSQATITLFGVTVETTILCRATRLSGKGEAHLTLSVYKPQKKTCPEDGKWSITPTGETSKILCGPGFTGDILRNCKDNGEWELPNDEFCVHEEFEEIKNILADIKDNIGGDTTSVLDRLANITDEKKEANITVGDLLDSIVALDTVVGITDEQEEIKETQINGFFSVANNIIAPSEEKWKAIKKKDKNIGVQLLKKMEDFGSIVANKASKNETTSISKPNLAVVVSKVSITEKNSFPGKVTNLDDWVKESKTTMDVSSNLLSEIADGKQDSMAVSVVLFRNISNILSDSSNQQSTNETKSKAKLNTMVLSITIGKIKRLKLENPIQLGFQHLNKVENLKALCSYWDFNKKDTIGGGWSQEGCEVASSNSSGTHCNCYHLTNFAVLTTLVPQDNKALTIITYVGCGISIGCCLLTIILYIYFWENMTKSELGKSKGVLMINMCVAVILAYTLFLAAIKSATVNKVACTTVAAFLHFFCLSLFFSLLLYAVDMAVTIFSVFIMNFNRLPLMLTLSWLLPAIIVGISLGVTNTEGYGNDDFCWLSVQNGVIWAFIGPIIFVIVVNTVILIYLFRTSMSSTTIKKKSNKEKIKSGAQSLLLTTPIFGITWTFGVFAVHEDTIAFQYVFAIINSLQGLFIFLAFCVLDKQFRQAVRSKYNRLVDLRSSRTFLSKSKRTQVSRLSQLKEQSSNYENAAFDQDEDSMPEYLNLEYMCNDEWSENVNFEFEAVPIESQTRSRRYLDDTTKFTPTPQFPGPRYSNNQSSWDNENGSNEPIDMRAFEPQMPPLSSDPTFKTPIIYYGNISSPDDSYLQYYQRPLNM